MEKKDLRKRYRALRRAVPDKAQKSALIARKLRQTPAFQSANTVALYRSLPEEVSTDAIFRAVLAVGKTPCFPKVEGGAMAFFAVDGTTPFFPAAFGIEQPLSERAVPPEEIDLMVVPLIAADKENYRLGFGGGYYDRFLKEYSGTAFGIAFREQISAELLPHEAHDVPLDAVITD